MDDKVSRPVGKSVPEMKLTIRSVKTTLVDLPIRRAPQFAATTISTQAYLIVEIFTEGGIVGFGEGVTPGGPWWSGDSVESMKVTIDIYLAPVLIGQDASKIADLHLRMNRVVRANAFAKAALDMACWDILGKALDSSVSALFGGRVREGSEICWALATGMAQSDIEEAEGMLERRQARIFKLKGGAKSPEEDARRAVAVAKALGERAEVRLDLNQAWDETTANYWLPMLVDGGVKMVEQPVQQWNFEGLARIRQKFGIEVMADESACTLQDGLRLASLGAVDVVAFKLMKCGGMAACRKLIAIAESAGIVSFGGTFLESSIGSAAGLHVTAAEPTAMTSEFFGGLWLATEIVETPLVYRDYEVLIPEGPGLGVSIDADKLAHFARRC